MNISVNGEYALQAVFDLSVQPGQGPVKIAEIARRQKIPQKFLELILAGLKQGGFVESKRGAEGGYLLARPASQITIGEVLRHVEGQKLSGSKGKRKNDTPFGDLWNRVDKAISGVVDETTFLDLATNWKDRQARYVPNWDI